MASSGVTPSLFHRLTLPLLALAVTLVAWQACPRGWQHDGRPMSLHNVDGELFFLQVPHLSRAGPDRLAVVRTGPGASFEPHTYQAEGLSGPLHIQAWAEHLRAPVVFNAGQFDARLHHLGWLKSRGQWLEPARKGAFQGVFVSAPHRGGPHALSLWNRIVDLADGELDAADAYDNVVQSMMLLDGNAQVRVRDSGLSACRTIVAEDATGRILVIVSEGAVTLHDLAAWLPHSGLHIVRAMNLDGGAESQMAITTSATSVALFGAYGQKRVFAMRPSVPEAPLPAVIAIVPRRP